MMTVDPNLPRPSNQNLSDKAEQARFRAVFDRLASDALKSLEEYNLPRSGSSYIKK